VCLFSFAVSACPVLALGKMDFDFVRAGWMYRQSSILKRWKKNWFTLSVDGMFRYFNSADDNMAEEAYEVVTDLQALRTEDEIGEVTLPEGLGRSCLLELTLDDSRVLLCAESPDDRSAWKIALEQARVAPVPSLPQHPNAPPPPYSETYPPQQTVVYAYPDTFSSADTYRTYSPPYVVQGAGVPGQHQQVVYIHDQGRERGVDGGDVAVGMLAGATMGTLLMGPMLWW